MPRRTFESHSWKRVRDTVNPFDDAPDHLAAGSNGVLSDPVNGGPFEARPGCTVGAQIIAGSTGAGQGVYTHTLESGTSYTFVFVNGKVYRATVASSVSLTDVTPTAPRIASGTVAQHIFCASLGDDLIVSDGVNKPWIASSLSSTPIVGTVIEYATPATILSIGSNDVRLANTAFTYTYLAGASIGQQATFAANAVGTAIGALGTITNGLWASILVELNTSTGALVFTAGGTFTGHATEALAIAALPSRTVTNWYVGYVTVRADAVFNWVAGTDAFAGGATGNQAQTTNYYAGEGGAWSAFGVPQVYQGSLMFIASLLEAVAARRTLVWSEPLDAATGYAQTDYDNQWTVNATGSANFYAIVSTNAGLFYATAFSWGVLVGTPSVDFQIGGGVTKDAVGLNIGCTNPATVQTFGNYIYFGDQAGRPWRFELGGAPEPIWLDMQAAWSVYRVPTTPMQYYPTNAWSALEPNLNLYLFAYPVDDVAHGYKPNVIYVFDADSGIYTGTWDISSNEYISAAGVGIVDTVGDYALILLGTKAGSGAYPWMVTPATAATWTDDGTAVTVSATTTRLGYSMGAQANGMEVRAVTGVDVPCNATVLTTNGIQTAGPQSPAGVTLLSIGSTDTRVASTAFDYVLSGIGYSKAAVAAGTAFSAQTIPTGLWGIYRLSIVAAGTITITPGALNTTGHATEALAKATLPATPALSWNMGYVTVQAQAGNPWIAATDALQGGTTGNEAQTTNYYAGETSFDGTYKLTFPLQQTTGRGAQITVAPTSTGAQWVLFGIEVDMEVTKTTLVER